MVERAQHRLSSRFYDRQIRIDVIGCGGTGSLLVPGLVRIHRALLAMNHPQGLRVRVWDDDIVKSHNVVRQNFYEADVGVRKVDCIIHRLNIAHAKIGLKWEGIPTRFDEKNAPHDTDFLIGCVDTKQSRRIMAEYASEKKGRYWLDCGNLDRSGQIVAGVRDEEDDENSLPFASDFFPELIEGEDAPDRMSCSARESLLEQGIQTNQMASTWALAWLGESLRNGVIGWCGAFFNLGTGTVTSIPVNRQVWGRMGVKMKGAQTVSEREEKSVTG